MAEQPLKLVLDTSIYIPFINQGIAHPILHPGPAKPLFFMSAVVIEELYAGAQDSASIKLLDRLYDVFASANRLLVPEGREWQRAGKIIAQMERKYGFEQRFLARITHDVLIALSARSIGATIATANLKDFRRVQEFVDIRILEPRS
jgi:predicted nucleic acid-binding protein